MSVKNNIQLKLLYTMEYLQKYSDEEHPVRVSDIITYLDYHGIEAERKSIYRDIERLKTFGMDIVSQRVRQYSVHYLASREFEPAELRLLMDMVQSSHSLSPKKTEALTGKLKGLASCHEFDDCKNESFITYPVKSSNESLYYTVDCVRRAMLNNHSISFVYTLYTGQEHCKLVSESERICASPFGLYWHEGRYCLLAYSHENFVMQRFYLDKMTKCEESVSKRICPVNFNEYSLSLNKGISFGSDEGKSKWIGIEFDSDLLDLVITTFSENSRVIYAGPGRFTADIDVVPGPCFFGWIFSLGGRAEIIYPGDVVDKMKAQIDAVCRGNGKAGAMAG